MSTSSNSTATGRAGKAVDTGLRLRAAPWRAFASLANELVDEVERVRLAGGLQQPGIASQVHQLRSRLQTQIAS